MLKILISHILLNIVYSGLELEKHYESIFEGQIRGYQSVNESYEKFELWAKKYPHLVVPMINIGESHKGNKMFMIGLTKIQNKTYEHLKTYPAILINSMMHARQKGSLTLLMCLFMRIIDLNTKLESINFVLQTSVIWFIPYVNIDTVLRMEEIWKTGYPYLDEKVYYRKNANHTNAHCQREMLMGIDLNRNFDSMWSTVAVRNQCSAQYQGASAFSEKQTQIIKQLYQDLSKVTLAIDLHAYGNQWIYPYTYDKTNSILKQNQAQYLFYKELIEQFQSKRITIQTCFEGVQYITDGAYIDWALDQGTYSLLYEVGNQFFQTMQNLKKSIDLSIESLIFVIQKNSFDISLNCLIENKEQEMAEVLIESKTIQDLNVRIEQIGYWRYELETEIRRNTRFAIKARQKIVLGISSSQKSIVVQIKSQLNNIYTTKLLVPQNLKKCSQSTSSTSHNLSYLILVTSIIITIAIILACIFGKRKQKANQIVQLNNVTSETKVTATETKVDEIDLNHNQLIN